LPKLYADAESWRFSVGSVLMDLPAFCSARRRSYRLCGLSQNRALDPKKWARRSAVSPVMLRVPFRICVTRLVGTRSLRQFRGAHVQRVQFLSQLFAGMNNSEGQDEPPSGHKVAKGIGGFQAIELQPRGAFDAGEGLDAFSCREVRSSLVTKTDNHSSSASESTRYVKRKATAECVSVESAQSGVAHNRIYIGITPRTK
jgi:hypothetical protein